jgi:hypothetical protein
MKLYQPKERDGDPRYGILLGAVLLALGTWFYQSGGFEQVQLSTGFTERTGIFLLILGSWMTLVSGYDFLFLKPIDEELDVSAYYRP